MNLLEQLQAENEALKSKIKENNKTISFKNEKIASLEKLNSWYIEQLKLRQKEKFGKSSEKCDENQLTLFDLFNEAETLREPLSVEPTEETLIPAHKRKKAKRGASFSNLPVETIEYTLENCEKICDICGEVLTDMKKEVRKELKIVPAQISIIEHVTYVYSCRNCDKNGESGFIKSAASPNALVPKSLVSPSVLAYILNQKYANAMPLYRQEQEWMRLGVNLTRQNLSNWILKAGSLLKPLERALKKELLSNELLHADETTLEVLHEPGRETSAKSYMWLYRTSKDATRPVILYDYQVGRSGDYAVKFLKGWQGSYLHCDGFSGYKKFIDKTLCGCLVHAKRKFHEASKINPDNEHAKQGESYIRKLFALEAKADESKLSLEERSVLRETESKPVLEAFYKWIDKISLKTLPQSLLGKAITYAINQKEYLSSFLLDSRIQLSNNLAEQSIKMFVIGRKNFLFSNTPNGAGASATIYGIIQTAIANNLKPLYYLEYIFEQMQINKELEISEILPWSDKIPNKCKI
ncbi:MAG: IS66 family transposase, partial [Anaerocolumna sp.]